MKYTEIKKNNSDHKTLEVLKNYLSKQKFLVKPINVKPNKETGFIVVIPCYNEPNLLKTLDSINSCELPKEKIEIIIVINSSVTDATEIIEQNRLTIVKINNWMKKTDRNFDINILHYEDLPKKYAGVGLARKTGMDESVKRFLEIQNPNGVIISLDADCTVDRNYFIEIEKLFVSKPKTRACTIYFEHDIEGDEYPTEVYNKIIIHELYLRYYNECVKFSGFPYYLHTIGSCFCVKALAYAQQGGMNKKQGGEDFYFLQKIFPQDDCFDITTTTVRPSPRISNRVPFGTGPVMQKLIDSESDTLKTYNTQAFIDLGILFSRVSELYNSNETEIKELNKNLPTAVSDYLNKNDFVSAIDEINNNTSNISSFRKRFYNWFNAFRILKFLNYSHDKFYNKDSIETLAKELLGLINEENDSKDTKQLLLAYREIQKQRN